MTEYKYLGLRQERGVPLALLISVGVNGRISEVELTEELAYLLARNLIVALGRRAGHRMTLP